MTEIPKHNLLTPKQTALVIGLKASTLAKRRQLGLPPRFYRIGKKILYESEVLTEFLNSCVRTSTFKDEQSLNT